MVGFISSNSEYIEILLCFQSDHVEFTVTNFYLTEDIFQDLLGVAVEELLSME